MRTTRTPFYSYFEFEFVLISSVNARQTLADGETSPMISRIDCKYE